MNTVTDWPDSHTLQSLLQDPCQSVHDYSHLTLGSDKNKWNGLRLMPMSRNWKFSEKVNFPIAPPLFHSSPFPIPYLFPAIPAHFYPYTLLVLGWNEHHRTTQEFQLSQLFSLSPAPFPFSWPLDGFGAPSNYTKWPVELFSLPICPYILWFAVIYLYYRNNNRPWFY